LIIEAKKEKRANPDFKNYNDPNWRFNRDSIRFTSSCLITKDKHAWKFGRFEMRAKIPVAPGMWPAFWTLGVKGRWPANGEIDIMEYYREKVLANAAWQSDTTGRPAWDAVSRDLSDFEKPNSQGTFHVWRMDWDSSYIKLYLDDQLLNTIDLASTINGGDSHVNPFHQPHYILINLAVGGSQGGDPTYTIFPQQFVVDYVRVYQRSD
jgi:beta-glucanase (GH16 family)